MSQEDRKAILNLMEEVRTYEPEDNAKAVPPNRIAVLVVDRNLDSC